MDMIGYDKANGKDSSCLVEGHSEDGVLMVDKVCFDKEADNRYKTLYGGRTGDIQTDTWFDSMLGMHTGIENVIMSRIESDRKARMSKLSKEELDEITDIIKQTKVGLVIGRGHMNIGVYSENRPLSDEEKEKLRRLLNAYYCPRQIYFGRYEELINGDLFE